MQLDMLQEDLFTDESQDTQHDAPSKIPAISDKSERPQQKFDLTTAQIVPNLFMAPAEKPKTPATGKPDTSKPVLVEQEMPSTAKLIETPPEDSSPIGSVLPVLGNANGGDVMPQLPVLESHDEDMPDDLYNDSHHSPELHVAQVECDDVEVRRHEEEITEEIEAAVVEGKAPGAFKTISEAAGLLGVPQHVLRFWESRFTQIKPLKMRGGRRYYRPEDMEILSTIKHLLYKQGYTIKGAKKVFSTRNREALDAAHRESLVTPVPTVAKKMTDKMVEKSVFVEKPVIAATPVFDDRKKKQLSNIRNELLGLRDTLSTYLN